MKQPKDNFSLTQKLMLSYISLLVLILIIGITLYSNTSRHVKNGINQQNRLSLHSSVSQLDSSMDVIQAAARQISTASSFNSLSDADDVSKPQFYYMGYEAQQFLKTLTPVERLLPLQNSFIYMQASRYVISPTVFSDYDFYLSHNKKAFLPSDRFSRFLMDSQNWNKFIPLKTIGIASDSYLYLYPLKVSVPTDTTTNAVLCYEFDYDQIREFFVDINLYDSGYLAAYDADGTQMFIYSQGNAPHSYGFLSGLSYQDQIALFDSDLANEEMLVTTAVSDYNHWIYYLVQPKENAYYSITSYQDFFTALTIGVFLLGGIMTAVFSSFGRKNLNLLFSELSATESMATSLHLLVEKQKPLVVDSYMRRIMEGSVTTNEEMQYIIDLLHLEHPDVKYHVLYTEVSPADDAGVQTKDMPLCIQNYDMLVREALRRYFPDTGYLYKPSDQVFAILLMAKLTVPFEQVIQDNKNTFEQMHTELLEKYGIWIRGGLGGQNSKISYTWKSYQQAKETKTIATTDKYIVSSDDFSHSSDVYYYSESLSVQLSGFISSGNKNQVHELFKLIHTENTLKRNLSHTQKQWLISDIRSTVFKKRHNITGEGLDGEKLDMLDLIDKQFDGEMSLPSLKMISLELCDVYGEGADSNDLILKIQEYINSNYHDSDLGLTKISETFGISENYFSFLFKKEASENFSSYLEQLRMAKAKEMILESGTSLSTLYEYLGYNNAASFRRAFKKNFGVSPKEMRDKINAK